MTSFQELPILKGLRTTANGQFEAFNKAISAFDRDNSNAFLHEIFLIVEKLPYLYKTAELKNQLETKNTDLTTSNTTLTTSNTALTTSNTALQNRITELLQEGNKALTEKSELESKTTDTLEELEDAQDRIRVLQGQVELLRDMRSSGQLSATTSANQTRRSAPHPDPDDFYGNNPTTLPAFLKDIHMKLDANADWYPKEADKMRYVVAKLKGDARDQVDSGILETGEITYTDVAAILTVLKGAYGNVNETKTAQVDIFSMHAKKSERFIDFLPSWLTVINKTKFDDVAKIAMFWLILPVAVRGRFNIASDRPTEFATYVGKAREYDGELRHTDPNYDASSRGPPPPPAAFLKLPSPSSIPGPAPSPPARDPDAMDLSAMSWKIGQRPKGDVQKAERKQYCFENDLCLWCTKPGHRLLDCKDLPANKQKAKEKAGKA